MVRTRLNKTLLVCFCVVLAIPALAFASEARSPSDQPGSIHGTDGDDVFVGGKGRDLYHGEKGNDDIRTGGGPDWINGGQGNDTLFGGPGDDVVFDPSVDEKHHQLVPGIDRMHGGSGVETMYLGNRDIVWAGSGNDRILSTHAHHGVVFCGRGYDTVYFSIPRPNLHNCEEVHRVADPTY
jgi:Ca2+-binding RTX toxin-like protein